MNRNINTKNQQYNSNEIIKNLAVCILFYEKLEQTIECIQSFLPSGASIYILNNGSSCSSRDEIGKFCDNHKQIKIFDSDNNLGVGVGRNYLITNTNEEWLFFVDSDITIKTFDWMQKINKLVCKYPDTEVFIPKLFNVNENKYVSYRSIRIVEDKAFYDVEIINNLTNTFPGGASFLNRRLFDRVGLYDDKMFVGFEDFEICIRSICLGIPIKAYLVQNIEMIHDHKKIKKNEDKRAVLTRYNYNYLEESFKRIYEKHNIYLESNWRNWVSSQIKDLLKGPSILFNNNWKKLIYSKIKKLIK